MNIWNYFVFPSINWEPKGQRVAEIIQAMALRPANVLFLDDIPANLREAEFFNPGIMTAYPNDAVTDLLKAIDTIGKDDHLLSRLHQYQLLEKKHIVAAKAASNEDFLRSCHIRICVKGDCLNQVDRLVELIQRSNQLNYTKLRVDRATLEDCLLSTRYQSAYILAQDDYGDYGIIGFYMLERETEERLVHFLFSCRTMGMGIEQYVYAKLNYPRLEIVGEVATPLQRDIDPPDWITEADSLERDEGQRGNQAEPSILFKGPCDTESSLAFLKGSSVFDTEFTFVNAKGYVISSQNSTYHILQSLQDREEALRRRSVIPFWDEQLYTTRMFTEPYDIVFLSVFKDAVSGLYTGKEDGFPYVFDDWFINATDPAEWKYYTEDAVVPIGEEVMKAFSEHFEYKGRIPQTAIIENVRKIRKQLPEETLLVISIPTSFPYLDCKESRKNDRHIYNQALASGLKEAFAQQKNVALIDYSDFANRPEDFLDTSNHFTKQVYYRVAQEYIRLIADWSGTDQIVSCGKGAIVIAAAKDWARKILRRSKTLVRIKRKLGGLRG